MFHVCATGETSCETSNLELLDAVQLAPGKQCRCLSGCVRTHGQDDLG
jgi:hypothetical protein